MSVLLYGMIIFILSFAAHFAIWKVRLPKNQTKVLLQTFLSILLISVIILWNLRGRISAFGIYSPLTITEYIHICLMHTSLTLAYITTYSAIEVDSPSLIMAIKIARAGSDGLSEEVLMKDITNDLLILPRIKELVVANMVYLDGDRYALTPKGLWVAHLFALYRRLLNLGKGG